MLLIFFLPILFAVGLYLTTVALDPGEVSGEVVVEGAADVVAFAPAGDGFVYGDPTGEIFVAHAEGEGFAVEPFAEIELSASDGPGLVGLALGSADTLYAAWIDAERRLVVAEVEGQGRPRPVWRSAPAQDPAGGHLEATADGSLVVSDPRGRLMVLDPEAGTDQEPRELTSGWVGSIAFDVGENDRIWLAGQRPDGENLDLVLPDGTVTGTTRLEEELDPSGLAWSGSTVAICGAADEEVQVFRVDLQGDAELDDRAVTPDDCSLGITALSDGRLLYSTGTDLRVIEAL